MVRSSFPTGMGAVGSTKAQFFHPIDKIRGKWPQDNKRQLENVLIIGKGMRIINKRNQWCYLVHIPKINNGSVFHIVKFNFTVTLLPKCHFQVSSIVNPICIKIANWLLLWPVKSILSGLLVVMLLQTLVSWETNSMISSTKELRSMTTTKQP